MTVVVTIPITAAGTLLDLLEGEGGLVVVGLSDIAVVEVTGELEPSISADVGCSVVGLSPVDSVGGWSVSVSMYVTMTQLLTARA